MNQALDPTEGPVRIAALIACHNRRDTTVRCLESLRAAIRELGGNEMPRLFLVDDGSTDGTAGAAAKSWPQLRLIEGDGSLFWAGAMALAEEIALDECPDATHLLWLNDDIVLDSDSIARLTRLVLESPDAILACALRDPASGEITYSGLMRHQWHPLRYSRVSPDRARSLAVDAFNGNLVLVPVSKARQLGGIDRLMVHQLADLDYGHRAREAGIEVKLAPGTFGVCSRNPEPQFTGTFRERWREFHSERNFPFEARKRFLKRHGGKAWPVFLVAPYPRFLIGRSRTGTAPAPPQNRPEG